MKRQRGARTLLVVLVFAVVVLGMSSGVAYAAYGQGNTESVVAQGLAAAQGAQAAQQPAAQQAPQIDPLAGINKVKLTEKNIVITLETPTKKNHTRNLVIDYSELIPGAGTSQAGKTSGRSPIYYAIWAFIGLSVLGCARRMVRRVVHR